MSQWKLREIDSRWQSMCNRTNWQCCSVLENKWLFINLHNIFYYSEIYINFFKLKKSKVTVKIVSICMKYFYLNNEYDKTPILTVLFNLE